MHEPSRVSCTTFDLMLAVPLSRAVMSATGALQLRLNFEENLL